MAGCVVQNELQLAHIYEDDACEQDGGNYDCGNKAGWQRSYVIFVFRSIPLNIIKCLELSKQLIIGETH